MPNDRMMQAIGRMEHALAKLEQHDFAAVVPAGENADLLDRHERLKRDTRNAIADIDRLLQTTGA